MSTPTDPLGRWSVFTFLPGTLPVVEGTRLVLGADLGFVPDRARLEVLGAEDVEVPVDDHLPDAVLAHPDCLGVHLETGPPSTGMLGIDASSTHGQVSVHAATDPDPELVRALVAHPGFIAGASGDALDQRWQSEEKIQHYRFWYDGPWEHLPRTTDDVGREVIDVSGNPGRRTDVPGMRMWAAQDTWFGPGSALVVRYDQVASLPVGQVTDLGDGRFHVHLWEDGTELDEIRRRQQALRDHLGYDDAAAREDEIWETLTADQPEDPVFVVEEGSFEHGGVRRFSQWFSDADLPTVRSRAARLVVQEFDADHQQVHQETVDLTAGRES